MVPVLTKIYTVYIFTSERPENGDVAVTKEARTWDRSY